MAQNKFLSFLNSMDKGASDRNSITEFLANILTPGDNMEYVDGQLLGSGGKPVENIGDKTYYGTLGQANFAGNDPVKDGLLSKMTSAPPKLRPLGLLNKAERRPDSMGVGYKTNMRPDALDLPMTSAPDFEYDYPSYVPGQNTLSQAVTDQMGGDNSLESIRNTDAYRLSRGNTNETGYINDLMPLQDSMGVGYRTNMRPDALDLPMTSAPDPIGSGRGDGAMEQQSREAQAKFNEFLQLVDPSVVDNARNNPEIMKVLRDAFFKTYPNLLRGMGGYN